MENATHDRDTARRKDSVPVRRQAPRFGAFVTIAIALLMLFGAASRFGNMPEPAALFGIDQKAEKTAGRNIDDILRATVIIGGKPAWRDEVTPPANALDYDPGLPPPSRTSLGSDDRFSGPPDDDVRSILSIPHQVDGGPEDPEDAPPEPVGYMPPAPGGSGEAAEPPPAFERPETYVVAADDTWVKIAKRTLGDSGRWRDIMNINPASRNGLLVGMRLRIPRG